MRNFKRTLSLLLSCLLLIGTMSAFSGISADEAPAALGGYAMHDFSEEFDSSFISFSDADPAAVVSNTFCRTTYAAAYYDGVVYGYVYGYNGAGELQDDFYTIDTCNNYMIDFPGGSSDGEFVYAMAYNYADSTMYALCDEDHPYIAAVDLKTGELTRVVDINLGSYLGLRGMAIDRDGNFYALTMSSINARLLSVDIENGSLTEIGATGKPAYYAQSITCDPATNTIYWAQIDTQLSNGLYTIDPENAEISFLGIIGEAGMEITGLYVVYDEQTAPPEYIRGDADESGEVDMLDALLALRAAMGISTLSELGELAADVDSSGTVTASDATAILRYVIGITNEL